MLQSIFLYGTLIDVVHLQSKQSLVIFMEKIGVYTFNRHFISFI